MPREPMITAFLRSVRRRLALRAAATGAAVGLFIAATTTLAGWPGRPLLAGVVGLTIGCIGILISILLTAADLTSVDRFVEARLPASRNLVATAAELETSGVAGYVPALVLDRAAALVAPVDPRDLVPSRRAFTALAAALAAWAFAVARAGAPLASRDAVRALVSGTPHGIASVNVTITAPSYTHRPPLTVADPSRVEAIAGSRLTIVTAARADHLVVETLAAHDTLRPGPDGRFTAVVTADADGYVALQPLDGGLAAARRLIGLTIIPDAPPHVKITAPGHDVVLPDGRASLDVAIEADDDIGLASLALRYTKVSGSGERFTFAEGTTPIQITRVDARHWKAAAHWPLASLDLGPGDMVVYRAVATDERPGAAPSESDALIAEVASPGGIAAPGFSLDPEQERYAVSQQMVILKTERLLAKRPSMPADSFANESAELAAEQRKVRSEFVFMLGGELADAPDVAASMSDLNEEAEAAGEQDILAGRNANAGHVALLRAIRSMSRAAAALSTADVAPALPHERAALASLESAFSRARIILRALTTRERLDLTRRLSGSLADAARETHPAVRAELDPRAAELRRALSDLAAADVARSAGSAELSAAAERIIRVDPSSQALQDIAARIDAASQDAANRRMDRARARVDSATRSLAAVLRSALPLGGRAVGGVDDAVMRGALVDALQRRAP